MSGWIVGCVQDKNNPPEELTDWLAYLFTLCPLGESLKNVASRAEIECARVPCYF